MYTNSFPSTPPWSPPWRRGPPSASSYPLLLTLIALNSLPLPKETDEGGGHSVPLGHLCFFSQTHKWFHVYSAAILAAKPPQPWTPHLTPFFEPNTSWSHHYLLSNTRCFCNLPGKAITDGHYTLNYFHASKFFLSSVGDFTVSLPIT